MAEPRPDPLVTSLTLIEKVRANEAGAWTRLIQLYTPMIRHWCSRPGVQESDVDDMVQEVCKAAFSGLHGFRHDRPGDTFRGWLRVVTRNVMTLHFRRKARTAPSTEGTETHIRLDTIADPNVEIPEEDPPEVTRDLYQRALELVRGEFEERTWQMFWLTVVDDRSPNEIASQFGVTPVAVRKAKSRVLNRLRREIGDLNS